MKIGLVLSGGGARGIFHLGVIQSLEEYGLTFHSISGTSVGALIGALYSAGNSPREVLKIIERINFLNFLRPALNWKGLINLETSYSKISEHIGKDSFGSLSIPLHVTATDLKTGRSRVFSSGDLIRTVMASCCIPVVFCPIEIENELYVDGGMTDNMPIQPILKSSEKVIGSHCNPLGNHFTPKGFRDMVERSLMIAITTNSYREKDKFDLFIEAPEMARFRVFDFKKAKDMFQIGYTYTQNLVAQGVLDQFFQDKQ